MTSPAANRSRASPLLISPNKALGERVGNGCRSDDITPLLCTASAVSAAAALKKKKKSHQNRQKGEGGCFAIGCTSFKTPPQKNLIVWPFAPSGEKKNNFLFHLCPTACSFIHPVPPPPTDHAQLRVPRVGPVFLKYSFARLPLFSHRSRLTVAVATPRSNNNNSNLCQDKQESGIAERNTEF